jgi:hypothetical protein
MSSERRVLTLELDVAAEPLAGVIRDERGTSRPFKSWLGLASTLELALGRRSGEIDGHAHTDRGHAPKSPESVMVTARTSVDGADTGSREGDIDRDQPS